MKEDMKEKIRDVFLSRDVVEKEREESEKRGHHIVCLRCHTNVDHIEKIAKKRLKVKCANCLLKFEVILK